MFVFGVLIFGFEKAQIENSKKIIDSISSAKWMSAQIDLDSLANPEIVEIKANRKDTIILKPKLEYNTTQEIPITPFLMVRSVEEKKWFFFGQNNLIFNQSSFSNWNSGGNNNIGVSGKINYSATFKNHKNYLENNIQIGYGLVGTAGQSSRKTEDYINLMTNYGYELGRNYYLSTGFQFLSQFSPGYNYYATPDPEFDDRISRFLAPAYFNAGLGISYNPNENFQVIFRPANSKLTFVLDEKIQKKGRYGLERDGQKIRAELGAMANILYRLKIYKDLFLINQLNLFSNYMNHAERVDISYNAMINMKFNKLISAQISADLFYDHDQIQRLQIKQTLGIGVSYNFGVENQNKDLKKKNFKPFIIK